MTEAEWLACTELIRMLYVLPGDCSRRKVRLFAVAYCHQVWQSLANQRCQHAVEISERFADSLATSMELEAAVEAIRETMPPATRFEFDWDEYAGYLTAIHASEWALTRFAHGASYARVLGSQPDIEASQCSLLRDIFGNPFRSVSLDPSWQTWHDGLIVSMSRRMYDTRDFTDMPILADALEEAGCTDQDILAHCRSGGEHVRGCWVVDSLLGKERLP